MTTMRPEIHGTRHAVLTGHSYATQAAFQMLEDGGNAIDAGVCAGIALGILQSDLVSIGGVAPIILYSAEEQRVITVAGLGWWPKQADPEYFIRDYGGAIPAGIMRTVIPAAPDAWITTLERWGNPLLRRCGCGGNSIRTRRFPHEPPTAGYGH